MDSSQNHMGNGIGQGEYDNDQEINWKESVRQEFD